VVLASQLGTEPTLVIFTMPIAISAYLGGLGPGLLATVLSYLASSFILMGPTHSFWTEGIAQRWNIFFVMLAGVIITVINEALHRARVSNEVVSRELMERAGAVKLEILQTAIFCSANFSCIATDARGVIQLFNVGAERMMGYAAGDVVNKVTPAELSDPKELIVRAAALSIELETPISPGFEALVFKASRGIEDVYKLTKVRKNGSRFPAIVSVTALRDEKTDIIGYLLIGTDNTAGQKIEDERRLADDARLAVEQALHEANAALEVTKTAAEKANLAKSDFLSSVSHELRTPLNAIIGFAEFMIDEKPGALNPKQKEYLSDVLMSGRHLLQLINDVLDLAKVESGKMVLHPETFAVRKVIQEVAAVIKGVAHKKHITLQIVIGPGLEFVTLDQHKFKQVLYNLLSNAVKFTDDDGIVVVHANLLDGKQFEVRVRDTGIGIRAEDMSRLFNEFEQLDAGPARRFEGTGLGLVLTKKFLEFQGGCISVESELGSGSVFTIVLPLSVASMETA